MTDDSLADVQQVAPQATSTGHDAAWPMPAISPGIAAAIDYVDGLHAFALAVVRCDVGAMVTARDAIEDAARRIAAQRY